MRHIGKQAVGLTAAAFLLLATAACKPATSSLPASAKPLTAAAAEPMRYETALAGLNAEFVRTQADIQRYEKSWGSKEQLALLHMQRAQLTGHYEDYSAAQKLLNEVQDEIKNPSATCASQARLDFAMHRLAAAAESIRRCDGSLAVSAAAGLELRGFEAEIALYTGRYDDAYAGLRAALEVEESISGLTRLSLLHAKTGHRAEALALLDRAERSYFGDSGQLKAWLQLQRAIIYLEAGRWEDSLAYLLAADRHLSGWWLVTEHIAEVRRLLGQNDAARALMETLVQQDHRPEHLDALARLLREGPNPEAAIPIAKQAEQGYRERLKQFPEASYGHATEHFLLFGTPAEALDMAQRNAQLRPYGEARILLAEALFRSGQVRSAADEIAAVESSGWDTPQLHAIAAQIESALGNAQTAEAQRAAALTRNDKAFRMYRLPAAAVPGSIN